MNLVSLLFERYKMSFCNIKKDKITNMIFIVAIMIVVVSFGTVATTELFRSQAIHAGVATYRVDPQTGAKEFIYGCPITEVPQ